MPGSNKVFYIQIIDLTAEKEEKAKAKAVRTAAGGKPLGPNDKGTPTNHPLSTELTEAVGNISIQNTADPPMDVDTHSNKSSNNGDNASGKPRKTILEIVPKDLQIYLGPEVTEDMSEADKRAAQATNVDRKDLAEEEAERLEAAYDLLGFKGRVTLCDITTRGEFTELLEAALGRPIRLDPDNQ